MNGNIEVHQLVWTEACNIIVGQSHFIKTVEDIGEIMATTVPGAEFGLAFCEASGPCLIRTTGNNEALEQDAVECAKLIGAGHSFFLVIKGAYPINVLNQIKNCQEVARIFAATSNPLQVLTVETGQGKGIIGVIDGNSPSGVETEKDKQVRNDFLRKVGYKY